MSDKTYRSFSRRHTTVSTWVEMETWQAFVISRKKQKGLD